MQTGTSLVVQWLGFTASNAGDMSSIPGWGNWDPTGPAAQPKKKVAALGSYWTKLTKSKKQSVLEGQVKLRNWMVESMAHDS